MSGLILENSLDNCDDLQTAAVELDSETLKKKLTLSRLNCLNRDDKDALIHEMIDDILYSSIRCPQNTQAVKCLKVLMEKGISLSHNYYYRGNYGARNENGYPRMFLVDYQVGELGPERPPNVEMEIRRYDHINVDYLKSIPNDYNPKSIYNTVKFVLIHGGKGLLGEGPWLSTGDAVILDKLGIMKIQTFGRFDCIGEEYIVAEETKKAMHERDAKGSKKTLRAFLKEKSEKKVSKAKTPKMSAKKQAEHE